jgi:hypothetical protein
MPKFNSGWVLIGIMCAVIGNHFIPVKKVSAAVSNSQYNAAYTSLLTKAVRCAFPKYGRYAADNIRFNGTDVSAEYRITHAFQILFDANGECFVKEVPAGSINPPDNPPVSNILTTNDGVNHLFLIERITTERGEYTALQEDFQRIPERDNAKL